MAKSKNKKKQSQKSDNIKKSNYELIIAFLLFFIATLDIFQAGYFGLMISDIFDIFFGDLANVFSLYLYFICILLVTNKTKQFYTSLYGSIVNLTFFTMAYIYHIYYLIQESNVAPVLEYKETIQTHPDFLGAGIIIHTIDKTLFTLFGGVGIMIPAAFLLVLIVILVLKAPVFNSEKIEKLKEKVPKIQKEELVVETVVKDEKSELLTEDDFLVHNPNNKFYEKLQTPFQTDINVVIEDDTTIEIKKDEEQVEEVNSEPFSAFALKKALVVGGEKQVEKVEIESVIEEIKPLGKVEPEEELVVTPSKKIKPPTGKYSIPPLDLLKSFDIKNKNVSAQDKFAKDKGDTLIATLASFKIKATINKINIGPNIIKYELIPEVGTKVARFSSLSNDIALALAASSVRIEAPIPGKSAIGIEIPNQKPKIIGLKEVLNAKNNDMKNLLQVGLGIDITGHPVFCDIKTTPHMLVAGSTGSGKSVCINSIIISILTKSRPEDVKLVLVDPKKVELTPFNGIPHLLTPVVTDPKKAAYILKKMVEEMESRYELFAETNTRNISSYNEKADEKLPYIVIIIDELADLMMVASKEVESSIARLAQMARACGIHLIIATQRPSTDVITGLIKANIPTRISFAVSSSIDSRTILDSMGAEKLLGRGDMLIMEQSSPNLKRLQGAFLSDDEVYAVVDFINAQENVVEFVNFDIVEGENTSENGELDPLYIQVKNDVIRMQKASTSYIQRQYKVGFNRATTIMEQLESRGVVSATEGTKPRKVLVREEDADL